MAVDDQDIRVLPRNTDSVITDQLSVKHKQPPSFLNKDNPDSRYGARIAEQVAVDVQQHSYPVSVG